MNDYQKELAFDARLKEKALIKDHAKANERHRFQKKWMTIVKIIVVALYFFITPLFEAPSWCLKYYSVYDTNAAGYAAHSGVFIPCELAYNGTVRYSGIPKVRPIVSAAFDIACLFYLCIYRFYKMTWMRTTRQDKIENGIFGVVICLCIISNVRGVLAYDFTYVNSLMRPVVIVLFFPSIRANLKVVLIDFKDSVMILISIIITILYFAAFGMYMYQGTFEGYTTFDTLGDGYYNLLLLITTTNFPDVMLYAYNVGWANSLFFIIYLLLGWFFLINVLLGIIFDNYRSRIEERTSKSGANRITYIMQFYD